RGAARGRRPGHRPHRRPTGLVTLAQLRHLPPLGPSLRRPLERCAMTSYTTIDSPLGTLLLARDDVGITALLLPTGRHKAEPAAAIGGPGSARAVGLANGQNPVSIIVPCHRVIGANGSLTGYGGGLPAKQWLLAHEAQQAGLFAV